MSNTRKLIVALKKAGNSGLTEAQARRFFPGDKVHAGGAARATISYLREQGYQIILRKNVNGGIFDKKPSQYVLTSASITKRVKRNYTNRPKSVIGLHKLVVA